jgi:hypothetical protein
MNDAAFHQFTETADLATYNRPMRLGCLLKEIPPRFLRRSGPGRVKKKMSGLPSGLPAVGMAFG